MNIVEKRVTLMLKEILNNVEAQHLFRKTDIEKFC